MDLIGTFSTQDWGTVTAKRSRYAEGGTAVLLFTADGEPLGALSTNFWMISRILPSKCFYLKDWSENAQLAVDALASPLFRLRKDLPWADNGSIRAMACEIVEARHE